MRVHFILVGLLFGLMTAGLAHAQSGYDRVGGDYLTFTVRNGDPAVCAARCERDSHCRAWSFSYPRTTQTQATCWLKNKVPTPSEDDCCVSGVRGAGVIEPRRGPIEYSIDRPGGDYHSFETAPDSQGTPCKNACTSESRCRAWTYARPGYGAESARCFLKSKITRPRHKPCCISGVVR
jgi:PAN domain